MSNRENRVKALDGLRAIACVGVMLFHFGVPGAGGGWLGVDAFFVLSGYLITGLLLAERDRSGRVDLGEFWRRRVTRIGPALLFTVAVALFPVHRVSYAAAVAALCSSSNVFRGTGHDLGILTPTWTLSVEERFYLVWPLAVFWLRTRRRVLAACAVPVRARSILGIVGISAILSAMLAGGFTAPTPVNATLPSLVTVIGTAIFISAVANADHSLTKQAMSWTPIAWVGRVSYPAYLLHVPVWTALAHRIPAPNGLWPIRLVVVIAATLGLSTFVHHGIEVPTHQWVRNRRTQVPASPVMDAIAAMRIAIIPRRGQSAGLGQQVVDPASVVPDHVQRIAAAAS